MESKIDIIRDIVAKHTARKVTYTGDNGKNKKLLMDAFTAHAVLTVYSGLNELNREKYMSYDWLRIVSMAWKLVKTA